MNLFKEFTCMPAAMAENSFAAVQLPGKRKDFLAKSTDGSPVFLLNDASKPQYYPSSQYKYLKAEYHATCKVCADGQNLQGQFAIVICDGNAFELHEVFIRCFAAVVEQLPQNCETRELNSCIQRLFDLFRHLGNSTGKEVIGLWAELFIIANSGCIVEALNSWHSDPLERFDISWPTGCLEIKATTGTFRIHHFALEQLMAPTNGSGYVASLLLQPLSGGYGVIDLANVIDRAVFHLPSLRQKLWQNLTLALGADYASKIDKHFDISFAERNVIFYNMHDIPRLPPSADPRISSIRFSVDLTTVVTSLKAITLKTLLKAT